MDRDPWSSSVTRCMTWDDNPYIVWSVWMLSHCLVACDMVYQPYTCTYILMDGGACQDVYLANWSSCYITHHPRKKFKVYQFSSIYPWHILWFFYGQYECDPLAWFLVEYCINLTHAPIDKLRGVSRCVCMIWAHGSSPTTQGRCQQCVSFHPSTYCTSLECCVVSIGVIPLLGCLRNGVSTTQMHPLIYWEGYQHMYVWLEIVVHDTPLKARMRSVPVFIHPHMAHCWSIVWPVSMWSPCLVACTMVYQPHTCKYTLMNWGAYQDVYEYLELMITHHPRQMLKVCQFSSLSTWHILWLLYGQYECDPLPWLLVECYINLTHVFIDELRGMSRCVWMIWVHGSSPTTQCRG